MENQPIKYKGIEDNLSEGLSNLGSQIRNLPHISLGKNTSLAPGGASQEVKPQVSPFYTSPGDNLLNPKEQNWINQLKKWGLVIIVCVIVGYAGYRILF